MEALNAWQTELTLAPMLEQELISNALATESPHLRTEVNTFVFSIRSKHRLSSFVTSKQLSHGGQQLMEVLDYF